MGFLTQKRKPDSKYQIGRGKIRELTALVKELGAEKVIFDNELRPVQAYNIAKETGVEAIDRFQLILEIFAKRASTLEAELQIELARLNYELSRAKEKVRLARLSEQPGFLGLGRYEVDLYYETIKRRIYRIKRRLKQIRKRRLLHRSRRIELGFSLISLAGYTNSGKSTLFNTLTKENVTTDQGLFTTLSTKTRAIALSRKRALLTDTVGFIDKLPITLVEAFKSTLEETIFSDVILLVVDISEEIEEIKRKVSVCLDTIKDIGATGVPIVTALNKIDLLTKREVEERLDELREVPNPVPISALRGFNINLLKRELEKKTAPYVKASFRLPNGESPSFLSWLYNRANVLETSYKEGTLEVSFEAVPWFVNKVKGRVEKLGGIFYSS